MRLASRLGTAVLACAAAFAADAQGWVPNEMLVSPQSDLLDPEYNQARAQFTWVAADGKLWVGNIDRDSGAFYPPDGKAILVDPDSMTSGDVLITLNGPEWVFSADGDGIAYTKFSSSRHSERTVRLGYARPLPDGTFAAGFLGPDLIRKAPYGSETPGDPRPRITYVDSNNRHYWRDIDDAATEQQIDGARSTVGPIRHVRGDRALVFTSRVDGVAQAFHQDLDSGVVTQLTWDAGDKAEVWMWHAPEFGGERVFMVTLANSELRIYRCSGDPPVWTPIYSARTASKDTVQSPEPFVYNARSYVFMQLIRGSDGYSSEIWVSNIDAANPVFKRISDNTVVRARTDPEVFVTTQGAFIYYNRRTLEKSAGHKLRPCPGVACSEGIYRADAGL